MDLNEVFRILWRRRLIVVASVLMVVAAGFAYLKLATPQYESESTLAILPGSADTLVFLGQIDQVIPIYADAAASRTTREAAAGRLGSDVGSVTIRTFPGTSIFKIEARNIDPAGAQRASQAVTDVLLERVRTGEVGIPGLELKQADAAQLPTSPVYPRNRLTISVAVILGLLLGVGVALLYENTTSRIVTADDLARVAGVPVFAEIPREAAVEGVVSPDDFATQAVLRPVAEALRDLRTNLLYAEHSFRSVVVTSPEGRHGKTTVSLGLAVTLAQLGARTLLVDGDLRRGRLAELLNIPPTPGLAEVLTGRSVQEVIRPSSIASLHLLTRGSLVEDPTDLIENNFHPLLTQLHSMYEAVVIDATPLVPINDARVMASFASSVVIVASADMTSRPQVRTAVERLALIAVKPSAVVLNKSKTRRRASYYAYLDREETNGKPDRRRRFRSLVRR